MVINAFADRANQRVEELLQASNREELERFRFQGSLNRVYRIPVGEDGEFVVLKLLPPRTSDLRRILKRPIRNLLYGERDVHAGRERVQMEVERYHEWQEAGLPVPSLVETTIPGARIIQGLPYPTFYSILCELDIPMERRMEVLRHAAKALASQHRTARRWNKKSLVHRDPGPWNIMFDLDRNRTYWFDLEHPAEYPGMSVEDLCVRGLRIFTFGVLDHLSPQFDEVMQTIVEAYGRKSTLRQLADNVDNSAKGLPMRAANRLGLRKHRHEQQQRIAESLRRLVDAPQS